MAQVEGSGTTVGVKTTSKVCEPVTEPGIAKPT